MPSIPNAYLYSLDSFEKYAHTNQILIPPVLIYLEPESSLYFKKRVETRGKVPIGFLNKQKTYKLMQIWYYDLVKKCYTNNNGMVLTSLENQIDLTAFKANEFLSKSDYSANRVAVLTNFLQNEKTNNS